MSQTNELDNEIKQKLLEFSNELVQRIIASRNQNELSQETPSGTNMDENKIPDSVIGVTKNVIGATNDSLKHGPEPESEPEPEPEPEPQNSDNLDTLSDSIINKLNQFIDIINANLMNTPSDNKPSQNNGNSNNGNNNVTPEDVNININYNNQPSLHDQIIQTISDSISTVDSVLKIQTSIKNISQKAAGEAIKNIDDLKNKSNIDVEQLEKLIQRLVEKEVENKIVPYKEISEKDKKTIEDLETQMLKIIGDTETYKAVIDKSMEKAKNAYDAEVGKLIKERETLLKQQVAALSELNNKLKEIPNEYKNLYETQNALLNDLIKAIETRANELEKEKQLESTNNNELQNKINKLSEIIEQYKNMKNNLEKLLETQTNNIDTQTNNIDTQTNAFNALYDELLNKLNNLKTNTQDNYDNNSITSNNYSSLYNIIDDIYSMNSINNDMNNINNNINELEENIIFNLNNNLNNEINKITELIHENNINLLKHLEILDGKKNDNLDIITQKIDDLTNSFASNKLDASITALNTQLSILKNKIDTFNTAQSSIPSSNQQQQQGINGQQTQQQGPNGLQQTQQQGTTGATGSTGATGQISIEELKPNQIRITDYKIGETEGSSKIIEINDKKEIIIKDNANANANANTNTNANANANANANTANTTNNTNTSP